MVLRGRQRWASTHCVIYTYGIGVPFRLERVHSVLSIYTFWRRLLLLLIQSTVGPRILKNMDEVAGFLRLLFIIAF